MSNNKISIVSGASRGLGLVITKLLLARNETVITISRGKVELELEKEKQTLIHNVYGDVQNVETWNSVKKILVEKQESKIDFQLVGLVLNAGVLTPMSSLADVDVNEWTSAIQINLVSNVLALRTLMPFLRASKSRVIAISSGAAKTAYRGWSAYSWFSFFFFFSFFRFFFSFFFFLFLIKICF